MLSTLKLPVTIAVLVSNVFATPTPQSAGLTMNLRRRAHSGNTEDWAKGLREGLISKYGGKAASVRRSTGSNLQVAITDQNGDSSFFGSLAIVLDTGSADLWVAGSTCGTSCGTVPTFDPTKAPDFSIAYGSATETVQMAGFSVSNQVFAVLHPFWETLASGGAWDSPVMSFQLTRFLNQSGTQALEVGGTFTMGFVNSTLYTGDIEYIDVPTSTNSYWIYLLPGNSVSVGTGQDAYAAIDTGTTLVGGPPDQIALIYAQIPGSSPATGRYDGYYQYPCDTTVVVTISFGGKSWTVSPADFHLTRISAGTCIGAFFSLTTGDSAPPWILGDTFLKNVYSVFRYDPPSIGFASLSAYSLSMNGNTDLAVPSPTIGSVSVGATARNENSANSSSRSRTPFFVMIIMTLLSLALANF
ncbi:aspartic peptidase A1 [Mycena rebaudengoi]|nr:aspartic peptidase A1 [Mycena rebaudengoi]